MSVTISESQLPTAAYSRETEAADRAVIDASLRLPVLFLYFTAFGWLLVALLLGFIASFKLNSPDFLGSMSWLTYGRIMPAFYDALIYGWAIPAGLGTILWIIARISRLSMGIPLVPVIGSMAWNIGVAIGILEVISGNSQGFQFIEFPRFVAAILFVSYAFIAAWAVVMLCYRREALNSVPVWYLCASVLWFPWLLASGYLILTTGHFTGVAQGIAGVWFAQTLTGLWFVSVGLGVAYYFISKISGNSIFSRQLALLGFWSFALFWGWTSGARLSGGPVPVWLITAGISASILILVPMLAVAANFAMTLRGSFQLVTSDPAIRFIGFGSLAWLSATLLGALTSLRSIDAITHFTQVEAGQSMLVLYAFYTMVMFGAMYYIIPRLLGREWLSSFFIKIHFMGSAYGIGFLVFLLIVGGLNQGIAWNNPKDYQSAVNVTDAMLSFLRVSGIAWVLLIAGNITFALHCFILLLGFGNKSGETISLAHSGEDSKS